MRCRTECFGLIRHSSIAESGKDTFVGTLRAVLDTKMNKEGTAAALTTRGHTTCIYKSTNHTWYAFDSLTGQLTCVPGGTEAMYRTLASKSGSDDPFTAMVFG